MIAPVKSIRGGDLSEQHVVYVGDGNNVANSLIEAAAGVLGRARSIDSEIPQVTVTKDIDATDGATAVCTDAWASVGQEALHDARRRAFVGYQVNQAVMDSASKAFFTHCTPIAGKR